MVKRHITQLLYSFIGMLFCLEHIGDDVKHLGVFLRLGEPFFLSDRRAVVTLLKRGNGVGAMLLAGTFYGVFAFLLDATLYHAVVTAAVLVFDER